MRPETVRSVLRRLAAGLAPGATRLNGGVYSMRREFRSGTAGLPALAPVPESLEGRDQSGVLQSH